MKKIQFEILGKVWNLRILPPKKYKKKHGDDSEGVCRAWKKSIDIHAKCLTKETLLHELTHAYLSEMCITSATEFTKNDLEEIYCELLSRWGRELLDLADSLLVIIEKSRKKEI